MHCGKTVNYIDYYDNGVKKKTIGFVRVREEKDGFSLKAEIMGMGRSDTFRCRVSCLQDFADIPLGEMELIQGSGKKEFKLLFTQCRGGEDKKLQFYIGERRYGECSISCPIINFDLTDVNKENMTGGTEENLTGGKGKNMIGATDDDLTGATREILTGGTKEDVVEELRAASVESVLPVSEESVSEPEVNFAPFSLRPTNAVLNNYTTEEKWKQLRTFFPILYPFEGQDGYISVTPKDLHLLASKYRTMEHNSFLLHSFHNYRHLIVGKYPTAAGDRFYLGVPGTFEEREQIMAGMFGFEGYEHSGGMGYYMIEVAL